jgi:hypothetical protein
LTGAKLEEFEDLTTNVVELALGAKEGLEEFVNNFDCQVLGGW